MELTGLWMNRSSIFSAAKLLSPNIALYLPRNSDLRQLAVMVPTDETIQAIHYCLNSRSKVCFNIILRDNHLAVLLSFLLTLDNCRRCVHTLVIIKDLFSFTSFSTLY